ncbi:hypothetical protein LCGC14_2272680 [marine sediment metagenome]|uniref:Uncharacterized protein n=1 Tax=marine sediment metagenome TaxID=412755 RepID=A0A0F9DIT0_9ZZZZ
MEWLAYTLVIVFGGIFAGTFIRLLKGAWTIHEPDKKMAVFELLLALGAVVFGIVGLIQSM